jgi:ATP-dependent helicase/nuclease subunit B
VHISTEAELAPVTALTSAAPAVLATISSADANTLERLRDRLGLRIESLDLFAGGEAGGKGAGALARLQRHLFNEHEKPSEIGAETGIEIFSAPRRRT